MWDVNAYVDPSVLTYAIQAIAGITIAFGTLLGLYGRKLRKLFFGDEGVNRDIDQDALVFRDPETGKEEKALAFLSASEIE